MAVALLIAPALIYSSRLEQTAWRSLPNAIVRLFAANGAESAWNELARRKDLDHLLASDPRTLAELCQDVVHNSKNEQIRASACYYIGYSIQCSENTHQMAILLALWENATSIDAYAPSMLGADPASGFALTGAQGVRMFELALPKFKDSGYLFIIFNFILKNDLNLCSNIPAYAQAIQLHTDDESLRETAEITLKIRSQSIGCDRADPKSESGANP